MLFMINHCICSVFCVQWCILEVLVKGGEVQQERV